MENGECICEVLGNVSPFFFYQFQCLREDVLAFL